MATTEEQYAIVYQGICAVASHCDGAITDDGVGFNGQDTKFGRRIASVPFDQWTQDVRQEAARIANRYQVQINTYTGIDVTTLQVVRDAKDSYTNTAARQTARGYEYRGKAKASRIVDVLNGELVVRWGRDPDFSELLSAVQALPGRRYLGGPQKNNRVFVSDEVDVFIETFDFNVTDAARAVLEAPREAPQAQPVHHEITLDSRGGKVVIDTNVTGPWNQEGFNAVRALPGRSYVSGNVNTADIHPDVLPFAARLGLNVHPDVVAVIENARAALEARKAADLLEEDRRTVLSHVSRQKDPGELPDVFVDMLAQVLPDAQRVIS
jgi:hypothetical protein